jgi:hypothetical protein
VLLNGTSTYVAVKATIAVLTALSWGPGATIKIFQKKEFNVYQVGVGKL